MRFNRLERKRPPERCVQREKSCPLFKRADRTDYKHVLSECRCLPEHDCLYNIKARQIVEIIEEEDVVATGDTFTDASEDVNSSLSSTAVRVQVRQSPDIETFYHQPPTQREIEGTNKGYQYGCVEDSVYSHNDQNNPCARLSCFRRRLLVQRDEIRWRSAAEHIISIENVRMLQSTFDVQIVPRYAKNSIHEDSSMMNKVHRPNHWATATSANAV